MTIRITGMNSGLDTEALISELVSAYRTKTQKYTKAQTKLSWKQTAWKDLNSKVSSFYSKLSSFRYSSAYNIRSTTVSDSTKATVTASASSINGTYSVKIKQMARSGYLTGGDLGTGVTANSTLSALGYTGGNGTITVNADGKTKDIAVTADTTISEFVNSLNSAGVKANYDATNRRIFVASSTTGKDSDFSLTGTDTDGAAALTKLGLSTASTAAQESYKNWAAYALNTDGKAYITDDDGNIQFNGTYDETATQNNISTLLANMQAASTTVTNDVAQIKYANAYQTVMDAEKDLSEDDVKLMNTLAKESDLTNVYVDADGEIYDKLSDGTYTRRSDKQNYTEDALADENIDLTAGADRLLDLQKTAGLTKEVEEEVTQEDGTKVTETKTVADAAEVAAYQSARTVKTAYEVANEDGTVENAAQIAEVEAEYQNGTLKNFVSNKQTAVDDAQKLLDDNAFLDDASFTAENVTAKISNAAGVLNGTISVEYSSGATRVNGQDAIIEINGAEYTSTSNQITVNGMTVSALSETGDQEITVNVTNNTQGLYDKIKDLLKEYNTLVNEMTSLYNAESAKGYEPLTDEEKDAMTDTEIEKWEEKIKASLLRRDDTLSNLMNSMSSAMFKSYTIDGKSYSLSSFGIHTLGVLYAEDNQENAFHIDGDSEDAVTSGNADKLMAALNEDPDTVVEFMKQLTSGLYDSINKKMSTSSISSFNVVYNDKEMAREYSDYTKTISKWEEKLQDIEDSYYKKFAAMEKALASLQSQQSSLANMLGY